MASDSVSMLKSLTFSSSMRQASSSSLIFHCGNLLMLYSVRHSPWTDSSMVVEAGSFLPTMTDVTTPAFRLTRKGSIK